MIVPHSLRPSVRWPELAMFALAMMLAGLGCGKTPAETAPPLPIRPVDPDLKHVILISIDTLRADHLGCYGHPFVKSPTIDRVAQEGWRFTRCISAAPTTLASHAALMTGTYPHTHGTPRNGFLINDENVMLAEVMKRHGFTTAAFIGSYALASAFSFNQGFDHFDEEADVQRSEGAIVSAERYADQVTGSTIEWLEKNEAEHYFLFVHYFDVHAPYDPPAPYDAMYKEQTGDFRPRAESVDFKSVRQALRNAPQGEIPPGAMALNGFYCGEITFTDSQIDRLLRFLDEHKILDHALLIITSDHGETMTEHAADSFFNHGKETYDTTVHVPLIVRFPGGQKGGRIVDRLVSTIDVMPTVLDWFGMAHPPRSEGVSFARLVDGDEFPNEGAVFAEATQPFVSPFEEDPVWTNARKTKCIVQDHWKLIQRPLRKQWELYDLNADRGEQNNLLETETDTHAAPVDELKARLIAWSKDADPLASAKEESEKTKSKLESLGYAH